MLSQVTDTQHLYPEMAYRLRLVSEEVVGTHGFSSLKNHELWGRIYYETPL